MVLDTFEQEGNRLGVIARIARQLGVDDESLRTWVVRGDRRRRAARRVDI